MITDCLLIGGFYDCLVLRVLGEPLYTMDYIILFVPLKDRVHRRIKKHDNSQNREKNTTRHSSSSKVINPPNSRKHARYTRI